MSLAADTSGKILDIVTTVRRLHYSVGSVCFSLLFLVKQMKPCVPLFSIFLDHLLLSAAVSNPVFITTRMWREDREHDGGVHTVSTKLLFSDQL